MAIDISGYMAAMLNANTPAAQYEREMYSNLGSRMKDEIEAAKLDRIVRINTEIAKIEELPKKKQNSRSLKALYNLLDKASA